MLRVEHFLHGWGQPVVDHVLITVPYEVPVWAGLWDSRAIPWALTEDYIPMHVNKKDPQAARLQKFKHCFTVCTVLGMEILLFKTKQHYNI